MRLVDRSPAKGEGCSIILLELLVVTSCLSRNQPHPSIPKGLEGRSTAVTAASSHLRAVIIKRLTKAIVA
jgi:hypothetical protein